MNHKITTSKRRLILVASVVLAGLFAWLVPGTAWQASAAVTGAAVTSVPTYPACAQVGSTATISGSGYGVSSGPIQVWIDQTQVSTTPSTVTVQSNGTWTASFKVPSTIDGHAAPGTYPLYGIGNPDRASTSFCIVPQTTGPPPAVAGPVWVYPAAKGTILSPFSNGLTLQVKPVTGSTGQYLFGLFKVNNDGTRTALYENWANERHLNGTTWTLGPGSPGLQVLQAQQGLWQLEVWARAWMPDNTWTEASKAEVWVNWPWTGWSEAPGTSGVYVHQVKATWHVPTLTCSSTVGTSPRAAVWVGMWGTRASMNNGTAWLPQIGTDSYCNAQGSQTNRAVWQIPPGSSTETDIYSEELLPIQAGDTFTASVTFVGFDPTKHAQFQFWIENLRTGIVWNNYNTDKATTGPATVDQVAGQGGAIVEDAFTGDGLAEFNKSVSYEPYHVISIKGLTVTAGLGGTTGGYTGYWTLPQWQMSLHGNLLAQNSALSGTTSAGGFTVTWKRQN
jgi:hypothetical protein